MNTQTYVGSTKDLRKRLRDHNSGKETSTKRYMPWELVYYEAFVEEKIARIREQKLKHNGNAIRELKKRIGFIDLIKSGAGFTLIELIVVFSIIAVLSTIGVASFVDYSRAQVLQGAENDIVAILNTAKSKASSQVIPTSCSGVSGYYLDVNVNTGTYALWAKCSNNTDVQVIPVPPLSSTPLPKGVTFNVSTNATSIFFAVLTGAVTGGGNIVLSGFSLPNKTITVDSVGVISSN